MKKVIFILFIVIGFISCEKEVFTGIVENNIYEYGKLFVSSNPNGYKIYIDNKNSALITPDTVSWLTEGKHKLTLKHDIYIDTIQYVDVNKLTVQSVSFDMLKSPNFYARAYCTSVPSGAKIYLNDQPTNLATPATVTKIFPGQCELKFVKNQCRDDSVIVNIKGGELKEISKTLEDTSRIVSYRTNNSKISSNQINKVIIDKFNNKWIGTVDRGLIKFDGKNWTSYEDVGAINGKNIQNLLFDKRGRLWVATPISLSVFDGISWQSLTDKIPAENVTDLEEDIYGNIWIAALNGLFKYDNSTFQAISSTKTGVPLNLLSSLATSKNGDLWIGTFLDGVIHYDGSKWTHYSAMDIYWDIDLEHLSPIINDLIVDKNGNVYVYHNADPSLEYVRALTKYTGIQWKEIKLPILFPLIVSSFYVDNDNNIWMAISGGLIKYNESGPLKVFDANTFGFYSSNSTSFCIDQNGDGWLTTIGGGIAKLKKGNF